MNFSWKSVEGKYSHWATAKWLMVPGWPGPRPYGKHFESQIRLLGSKKICGTPKRQKIILLKNLNSLNIGDGSHNSHGHLVTMKPLDTTKRFNNLAVAQCVLQYLDTVYWTIETEGEKYSGVHNFAWNKVKHNFACTPLYVIWHHGL